MKVTLKQKKLASGKMSLYIEYYKGSYKDENGKEKHNREFEYLNQYLIADPTTKKEKDENQQTLQLAEDILALRKADILTGKYGFINPNKGNYRLYDYFDTLKENRSSYLSNYGTWVSTRRYIEEFFHISITFNEITPEIVESFKRYLDIKATTKYGTLLKHGSKYSYFNRFRAVIKSAYEEVL